MKMLWYLVSRLPATPIVARRTDIRARASGVEETRRGETMSNRCKVCGYTESQAMADARTLGLQPELQSGLYTCCQIAEWAEEQRLAWFEATQEDGQLVDDVSRPPEF